MTIAAHALAARVAAAGLSLCLGVAGALAQSASDTVPTQPETANVGRIFLDTLVTDVLVDDVMTVAVLDASPRSPCASNAYTYLRDRPKWLYETGRLLQALREPARIRVSFSCVEGRQEINAIQFLSPPRQLARAEPSADLVVRNTPSARRGLRPTSVPLPTTQEEPARPAVEPPQAAGAADGPGRPQPRPVREIPIR